MKYVCTHQFYFTIAEFASFCFDPKIQFERDDSSENFFAFHQFYLTWSNLPLRFLFIYFFTVFIVYQPIQIRSFNKYFIIYLIMASILE